jgi:predicted aminopeptidase
MNTADQYVYRWTSVAETEAIRRDVEQRELIRDYIQAARDAEDDDRRETKRKRRDAFAAVLVSVIGVGMFLLLAICFGGREL